ncbi:hypothetical protein [Pseudarthrobacter sp. NS4]|uniref:hypothetical protein n=1 Tax=Pseudarthrobacter sp. NS4 TaxID=2973976 RepID=UPI0021620EEF|nr:hypothetical protein [Pseudarthrobacter sp. NS4]
METLKKIASNQYFPAGAVLTAVVLFWAVGLLGGLSLLHNNQPPLATLTWMLFVYMAAVLTPIAGLLAALDLIRRWRRNRAAAAVSVETAGLAPEAEPATPNAAAPAPESAGPAPRVPAEAAETGQPAEPAAPAGPAAPAQSAAPAQPAAAETQPARKKSSKHPGRKQAA